MQTKFESVDQYINSFTGKKKEILEEIRRTIRTWIPNAEETISYQMPTFKQNGVIIHYGMFQDHISFFPTGSGVEKFEKELGKYRKSKGTISISLSDTIPWELIEKIVRFKVEDNLRKKKK